MYTLKLTAPVTGIGLGITFFAPHVGLIILLAVILAFITFKVMEERQPKPVKWK